jgi:hypothetical protein
MKKRKLRHPHCDNPDCINDKFDRLFEMIGESIPIFKERKFARRFGIYSADELESFLEKTYNSHDVDAVLAGRELLGEDPVILRWRLADGDEGYVLYSLKSGPVQ